MTIGVPRRKKRGSLPDPRLPAISDRLVEDARIFLLIIQRRRTSYDRALDGLVRDAFGSADRLRVSAAAARACGRLAAEADLLERAADRVGYLPSPPVPGPGRT